MNSTDNHGIDIELLRNRQTTREDDILEMVIRYNAELLEGEPEMTVEEIKVILGR